MAGGRLVHLARVDGAERDLDGLLTQIAATGYDGFVGLEYKPTTTTSESLAWLPISRRA
ncbi:MAG TPA: hypothetical protein PK428_04005 [Phycicoccus sp.]|nr:hypothetical protein [Phycicoccus sp.]